MGNFYGYLKAVKENGEVVDAAPDWESFQRYIAESEKILGEIHHIEKDLIGAVNYEMERLRLRERGLVLNNEPPGNPAFGEIEARRAALQEEYNGYTGRLTDLYERLNRASFVATLAGGREVELPFAKVVRAYRPNAMGITGKIVFYFGKLWEFVSGDPREANTEGGIFPAIFGTVLMVMIMAVLVTPFGVVAAVYLREYARQGPFTRLVRIAVNNLAGVPSVVYGVFGLGFFVYFLGGTIDELFFVESLPAPTFGTPGIMWASLTMAILTVPVVIVSTEEGLARVPRAIREGSLALGATKAETLWRTVSAHDGFSHVDGTDTGHCPGRGRGRAADACRCCQAGPVHAVGRELPVPAPGQEIHAPGVSYLRRGFPEPERRSGQAAGLRDRFLIDPDHYLSEPGRNQSPQHPAGKVSGSRAELTGIKNT